MSPPCLQAFPSHREHAHLAKLPPPAKFHIVLGDGSAGDDPNAVTFRARSSKGANEGQLRSWLQPHEHETVLMFEHLYHRFEKFKDGGVQAEFDARLRAGLRPAPELQVVITLLVEALRGRGGYNCLHVSAADLERNGAKVFSRAARLISPRRPTLLSADAALGAKARSQMSKHFDHPLYTAELLPPRQRALFEDVEGRITLALELVDMHVCAAAQSVVGNLLTPFAQGVCYERDGLRGAAIASNATSLPRCMDLYSRSTELKGLRWF